MEPKKVNSAELTEISSHVMMFSGGGLWKQIVNPAQYKSVNRIGINSPKKLSTVKLASTRSANKRPIVSRDYSRAQSPLWEDNTAKPISINSLNFRDSSNFRASLNIMQAATIERDEVSSPHNGNLGFERTGFIRTRRFSAVPGSSHHRNRSISIASGTILLDSPKSNVSQNRRTLDREKTSSIPG